MFEQFADLSLPPDFDNKVRLFPLPSVVLLPGVVQALHIFEPRYREMLRHCLETDQLITMALLDPEQPVADDGTPAIDPVVCIGRVLTATELDDGRYNLFLVGVKRAAIKTELPTGYPYRIAQVSVHDEDLQFDGGELKSALLQCFLELVTFIPGLQQEVVDKLIDSDLPFSRLLDIICLAAGLTAEQQQQVLATFSVQQRGKLVDQMLQQRLDGLRKSSPGGPDFPPSFSLN